MKKWILMISAALILAFVLFIYVSFNGNPISQKMAKNILDEYIGEVFEGSMIAIDHSGYNFKDASYYFLYTVQQGEQVAQYSSEVKGAWIPSKVSYTNLMEEYTDRALMEAYHMQANRFINQALTDKHVPVHGVSYDILIAKGQYEAGEPWKPNMPKHTIPSLWIDLKDEQQTKEQFTETVKVIQQTLAEKDVSYTNVHVAMTRKFDNTDGKKEGYAPFYYETIYMTSFTSVEDEFVVRE